MPGTPLAGWVSITSGAYTTADANRYWANQMVESLRTIYAGSPVSIAGPAPTPTPPKEVVPTETLFEVFVVSKTRKLILREFAVAKDEHGAQFRAGVDSALRGANLEPDDVTILCRPIGQVEVEKKPQKMQIVKDAGDVKDGGNG
jgi:hypothetical protein